MTVVDRREFVCYTDVSQELHRDNTNNNGAKLPLATFSGKFLRMRTPLNQNFTILTFLGEDGMERDMKDWSGSVVLDHDKPYVFIGLGRSSYVKDLTSIYKPVTFEMHVSTALWLNEAVRVVGAAFCIARLRMRRMFEGRTTLVVVLNCSC